MNRGGSFDNAAVNGRSANRNDNAPENANNELGVRPAKASLCPIAAAASISDRRPAVPRP